MMNQALREVGIPVAMELRAMGWNIRANQRNDRKLIFEIRDTKSVLTFNNKTKRAAILRRINKHLTGVRDDITATKNGSEVQQGKYTC